jgi:hypothetical protein
MSTRWFFSWAQIGAAIVARTSSSLTTSVTFTRVVDGTRSEVPASGPTLRLLGPGDVAGFDRSLITRCEPPPGATEVAENILAQVELAHADLPWLLAVGTAPEGNPQPWLALVVLAEDEAALPRQGSPLPVLTAPIAALPPLAERWAWAHVEGRLDDSVTDLATAKNQVGAAVRSRGAHVVARLLCPRRLAPNRGYLACLVPATAAGREAGLPPGRPNPPGPDAWPVGGAGTVELPVYHWWTFRTAEAGTFENLARRLRFRATAETELGSRVVDVSRPWPVERSPKIATVALDGALRVPASVAPAEHWSDTGAQQDFVQQLTAELDAPARRREARPTSAASTGTAPTETEPTDRDVVAVAPPLYGSHHTGQQIVPDADGSWMKELNLQIRRRVAAALGARYVQLEQEFLMARAWEQGAVIRQANRVLAAAELAAAAAALSQRKHLDALSAAALVATMAPARHRLLVTALDQAEQPVTLATALASTAAPSAAPNRGPTDMAGVASTAFSRLTRPGGGLARRVARQGGIQPEGAMPLLLRSLTDAGMMGLDSTDETALPTEVMSKIRPMPLQVRRTTDRIPELARDENVPRPLAPIMAHPRFAVPIAEELLARWPEWALPGIGGLPADTVTLLATNPEFVAALMVGLNHEFNRELLWREFPTDQRGTAFAQFWPGDQPDIDEIARWPLDSSLGSRLRTGEQGSLALLVRGELLRRFPSTSAVAVRGENGALPTNFTGIPATALTIDESTMLYLFGIDERRARAEGWFFVFREPMRGTQFGFDLTVTGAGPADRLTSWSDLTWDDVGVPPGGFVRLGSVPPGPPPGPDVPVWGGDPADMARIAFQRPFQLAFDVTRMLGVRPT